MPSRARPRVGVYNTPTLRNGGFGVLQVEAVTNRPLSIARRHLAASQLRMREIEPDELSSSEWVRFLVMEERERERWMSEFCRRRRNSNESNASSSSTDADLAYDKAEEARQEAEEVAREEDQAQDAVVSPTPSASTRAGRTPSVSIWARQFDEVTDQADGPYSARRPRHMRRAVTDGIIEAPPTYENASLARTPTYEDAIGAPARARTPPPAYEPRSDDEGSPRAPRHIRFAV